MWIGERGRWMWDVGESVFSSESKQNWKVLRHRFPFIQFYFQFFVLLFVSSPMHLEWFSQQQNMNYRFEKVYQYNENEINATTSDGKIDRRKEKTKYINSTSLEQKRGKKKRKKTRVVLVIRLSSNSTELLIYIQFPEFRFVRMKENIFSSCIQRINLKQLNQFLSNWKLEQKTNKKPIVITEATNSINSMDRFEQFFCFFFWNFWSDLIEPRNTKRVA